ncbi:MAG: aromatic ring-hydroxylating dioxygenase subunit alpha, partial [Actinobacteria bacterium]|nr:aromatic ring-hydroxylating dioxygenase subunit alpha [Actinomycetota bacterium]
WVYDLQGQLVGAPEMSRTEGFDRAAIRLPSLRVELWEGFVFVNFDPDAEPLAPRMAPATELLRNWHIEDMTVVDLGRADAMRWNWKIMLENFVEPYHTDRLHHPLHELAPASNMISTPSDVRDAVIMSRAGSTRPDYSFNATLSAFLPVIETLDDDDRAMAHFAIVPPTLSFATSSDSLLYLLTIPRAAGLVDLVYGTLFPKSSLAVRRFEEKQALASIGWTALMNQDVAACESVQRGLQSRYATRGRYSWQEEPIAHFNRWLVDRYRAALARTDQP